MFSLSTSQLLECTSTPADRGPGAGGTAGIPEYKYASQDVPPQGKRVCRRGASDGARQPTPCGAAAATVPTSGGGDGSGSSGDLAGATLLTEVPVACNGIHGSLTLPPAGEGSPSISWCFCPKCLRLPAGDHSTFSMSEWERHCGEPIHHLMQAWPGPRKGDASASEVTVRVQVPARPSVGRGACGSRRAVRRRFRFSGPT